MKSEQRIPITVLEQPLLSEDADPCCSKKPSVKKEKINLLDFNLQQMQAFFISIGEKSFRADQVFKWIHQRTIDDFSQMTDLSKLLREQLPELCEIKAPKIAQEHISKDGTKKWLIQLEDGNFIETVFIPERGRGTLCVSSQVGCALNCSFCSTATQGFNRNLSTAEIIGQVWLVAKRLNELNQLNVTNQNLNTLETGVLETLETFETNEPEKVTNVVMMGMGEPMLNYDAVLPALSIMRDEKAYALPRRRVTLSTSGLIPYIDRLSVEADVSLALSLHAPNNALRDELVPINKKYPIAELMEACKRFAAYKPNRHITMEYVMLRDVNDKPEHAKQLIKILQGVACKVNLIPFNPFPGAEYLRSRDEDIEKFRWLVAKSGFVTTVRRTRGGDIDAACGQLVGRIQDRTKRNARFLAKVAKNKTANIANIAVNSKFSDCG